MVCPQTSLLLSFEGVPIRMSTVIFEPFFFFGSRGGWASKVPKVEGKKFTSGLMKIVEAQAMLTPLYPVDKKKLFWTLEFQYGY